LTLLAAAAPALWSQENPNTRSITLPGERTVAVGTEPARPHKADSDPQIGGSVPTPEAVAASLALAPSSGDREAEPHYKTAVVALKDDNLAIAADEMAEAAKLSPDNALVLYGLAVVEARNKQPELALPNLEKAMSTGLPANEAKQAEDLIASVRYAIRKDEAEKKKVTPTKLWGSYEAPLEEPVQEFVDRAGRQIFETRAPLVRGMYLWRIVGESNIVGHWLEKTTLTEETIFADPKRHDVKPKVTTDEHWWLVSILINPDGTLEGSRMVTCVRQANSACPRPDPERGKVVSFKGRVEPNGDLTIRQENEEQEITLKKKSRMTTLPPYDVRIPMD